MTQRRQLENKLGKVGGSILGMWGTPQTKEHPPGRETAALCIKTVIKLAEWRKLLERGE